MLVKALERGFIDRLIEPGETFEIQPEQFGRWMEKVEGGASAPPEPLESPKRRGRPKKVEE